MDYNYNKDNINIDVSEDTLIIDIDFKPKDVVKFKHITDKDEFIYFLYLDDREDNGSYLLMSVINPAYLYIPKEIFDIDTTIDITFKDDHIENASFYIIEDFNNDGSMLVELISEGYMPTDKGVINDEDYNYLMEYYKAIIPIYYISYNLLINYGLHLINENNNISNNLFQNDDIIHYS